MSKIIEKSEKSKNSITDIKKLVNRQTESSQKDTERVIEEVIGETAMKNCIQSSEPAYHGMDFISACKNIRTCAR